jgi:hypothetical protein
MIVRNNKPVKLNWRGSLWLSEILSQSKWIGEGLYGCQKSYTRQNESEKLFVVVRNIIPVKMNRRGFLYGCQIYYTRQNESDMLHKNDN